jgi:integrase
LTGHAVRVTDTGKVSFYAVARRSGESKPSWIRLGSYPGTQADGLTLKDAREKAKEALSALMEGKDPTLIAEEKRREVARTKADTFDAVAKDFVKRLESGRDAKEMASVIRREWQVRQSGEWANGNGQWHGRPIADISRRDIREAIAIIIERAKKCSANGRPGGGPHAARHAFAAVRRLFNWAVSNDILDRSPCEGLNPADLRGAPVARDRWLDDDELRLVWLAAQEAGYPFGALVKMLLLTGQRRDEIAEPKRSEVDGDLLTVRAARAKNGLVQTVPLCPATVEILAGLPEHAGGDYLFSTTAGKRPIEIAPDPKLVHAFDEMRLGNPETLGDVLTVTSSPRRMAATIRMRKA